MTREQAKKNLEIIKAFAEGKTVQFRNKDFPGWTDSHDPAFHNIDGGEYRIKPEPRTWWCPVTKDVGWICVGFTTREAAERYVEGRGQHYDVIQVREVL